MEVVICDNCGKRCGAQWIWSKTVEGDFCSPTCREEAEAEGASFKSCVADKEYF